MSTTFSLRLADGVTEELAYLSNVLGVSRSQVINLLIRQEYSKYQDDPVIKEYIEKMKQVREILSDGALGQMRLFD